MQQMYHPDDLASMDPLVLMKNLDHVRMTARRLSYVLQGQVHLYRPEANELRLQIDHNLDQGLIRLSGNGTVKYSWRGLVFLWCQFLKDMVRLS